MFSINSSKATPGFAAVVSKAYRFTTTMSIGAIPCSATAATCLGSSRRCKIPPCTLGCSVLTRPSSISGKPVISEISLTLTPDSRSNLAVPPVEMSSMFRAESLRAKSTSPVLSVTERMARWMRGDMGPLVIDKNADFGERKFYQHSVVGRLWLAVSQDTPPPWRRSAGESYLVADGDEGRRSKVERRTTNDALRFRLGFQLDLAVREFDRILHALALVLFADLFGLLLHERGERIDVPGDVLAGFLLGGDQSVVKPLDLLPLALVHAVQRKWLGRRSSGSRRCGLTDAVHRVVLSLVFIFCDPNSLHRKQGILRTAIAFFPDSGLFPPQIAVHRISLRHFVVAITLGEVHAAAVGKLAQQAQYLPLDVSGRPLGRVAEIDLVLDLQTPQLRVENVQFLVGGHKSLHAQFSEIG